MFTMCVLACQLLSLECVFYADQLNTITTKDEGVNKVLFFDGNLLRNSFSHCRYVA